MNPKDPNVFFNLFTKPFLVIGNEASCPASSLHLFVVSYLPVTFILPDRPKNIKLRLPVLCEFY